MRGLDTCGRRWTLFRLPAAREIRSRLGIRLAYHRPPLSLVFDLSFGRYGTGFPTCTVVQPMDPVPTSFGHVQCKHDTPTTATLSLG